MKMKKLILKEIEYDFLELFFLLLGETIISYGKFETFVIGIVSGIDEDIENLSEHQNFIWQIRNSSQELTDMLALCEYMNSQRLVQGDKISISESELVENLLSKNWKNETIKESLEYLLSLDIRMVDDGEETDSFFIHF